MSELRRDPLSGRWVIVASERGLRPSDFETLTTVHEGGYCPFCPGHEASTGSEICALRPPDSRKDEPGWTVRVVPNKFPALRVEEELSRSGKGLYDSMSGVGAHEVIIETPGHRETLATIGAHELEAVLGVWRARIVDLKRDERLKSILVYKNRGAAAGATIEHEHSQLVALPRVPREVKAELRGARRYYDFRERCLLCDVIEQELEDRSRLVHENAQFVALCPYASRTPFQAWILPRRHDSHFEDSPRELYASLADCLRVLLRKLDRALENPAYNLLVHTAPPRDEPSPYVHWRLEILPALTRPGGFEWASGYFINPTPPEEAAEFLRKLVL